VPSTWGSPWLGRPLQGARYRASDRLSRRILPGAGRSRSPHPRKQHERL